METCVVWVKTSKTQVTGTMAMLLQSKKLLHFLLLTLLPRMPLLSVIINIQKIWCRVINWYTKFNILLLFTINYSASRCFLNIIINYSLWFPNLSLSIYIAITLVLNFSKCDKISFHLVHTIFYIIKLQ